MSEMRTFRLDKLVRDKIVGLSEQEGGVVDYEVLNGQELVRALVDKFDEELTEVKEKFYDGKDVGKELIDLIQVAKDIGALTGHSYIETESGRGRKESRVGGFATGHFVRTITLPANSEWAKYYASDPERFPEIKD